MSQDCKSIAEVIHNLETATGKQPFSVLCTCSECGETFDETVYGTSFQNAVDRSKSILCDSCHEMQFYDEDY